MDYADRASELNKMLDKSLHQDYEKEEDEVSIDSDAIGFGLGNLGPKEEISEKSNSQYTKQSAIVIEKIISKESSQHQKLSEHLQYQNQNHGSINYNEFLNTEGTRPLEDSRLESKMSSNDRDQETIIKRNETNM